MQRSYVTNILSFCTSIGALAMTIVAARLAPTVAAMVLAALLPMVVARATSGVLLHRTAPALFGGPDCVNAALASTIVRRGLVFAWRRTWNSRDHFCGSHPAWA